MKVSWNWLCELVALPKEITPQEVAERLSISGVAVDALVPFGLGVSGVVVAEVRSKKPHPKADKLTLVEVFCGQQITQVVCGAPNVPEPQNLGSSPRVLWAKPGATIKNGLTLSVREVRGIASPGMLCAEDELGLSGEHGGIVVLSPEDGLEVGSDFAQAVGLPDYVFELDITPNRPDLLGHIGVAREVAALFREQGARLIPRSPRLVPDPVLPPVQIEVEDADSCPRYVAQVVRGVTVHKSPLFYRLRLERLGLRAVSNVVDATNLAMLEFGQPLHAFDLDQLGGGKLFVRRAKPSEKITTLDGVCRDTETDDLLIADENQPVAIAGVMGGRASEVSSETKHVLLECAHFAPTQIRRTAKRLKLHTEASHRFERGTDPNALSEIADVCAGWIARLAGGQLKYSAVDVYPRKLTMPTLVLRPERTAALLGLAISIEMQQEHLSALGLSVKRMGERLSVDVPTRRPDLTREVDLIEEVARIHGLSKLPATLPKQPLHAPAPISPGLVRHRNADTARRLCAALGLLEVVLFSMASPQQVALGQGPTPDPNPSSHGPAMLHIDNPLREELSVLRTRLLPGLLEVLKRNVLHGRTDVRLFEVGEVFDPPQSPEQLPTEHTHVAAVLFGKRDHHLKATEADALDFFDVKGLVQELSAGLGWSLVHAPDENGPEQAVFVRAAPQTPMLHPGAAAELCYAKTGAVCGTFGELHPDLCRLFDLPGPAFVFELVVPDAPIGKAPYQPASRFPAVCRDLSFFVAVDLPVGRLFHAMQQAHEPLLSALALLDDYRASEHVPPGQKGLLFSLTYRSDERTLTDDEVQKAHQKIIAHVAAEFPIALRA